MLNVSWVLKGAWVPSAHAGGAAMFESLTSVAGLAAVLDSEAPLDLEGLGLWGGNNNGGNNNTASGATGTGSRPGMTGPAMGAAGPAGGGVAAAGGTGQATDPLLVGAA